MRNFLLAICIIAAPNLAHAQLRLPPNPGRFLEVNHTIATDADPFLRLRNVDGVELFTLESDGSIVLDGNATIDFKQMQRSHGPLRGYVRIRVNGEDLVMPVFQPTEDGSIWRDIQPLVP